MLDLSHIPSQQQQTFTFYSVGAGIWQTWNKPRNAKMIEIFCLGGGGGGSTGTITAANASGGAGGSSGGIVRGLIPAFLLPDTLYILIGKGGAAVVTSNQIGTSGAISYIGLQPSTSEQTLICKSSTTAGQTTTAPTISVVSLSAFGNLGLFTAIAGVAGGANGATTPTAGGSQAALGTSLVTGGGGGGGKSSVAFSPGGSITSASAILVTPVIGGQTSAANGADGYGTLQPFCGTGGAGGAGIASGSGAGGSGGDGWFGCGGGGGAGTATAVARSGKGGDGLVIITVIT